jgi:two-component system, NtrC family, sensor kinase
MKFPLKTRLSLMFLTTVCLIGLVSTYIANSIVTNHIIHEVQERVKQDLNTARYVYASKVRDVDRTIRWASIRHVLKDAIKKGNVSPVQREFMDLLVEEKLDFLTFLDRNGTVMFRFHNPGVSGDDLRGDPFVRKALDKKGASGTQVIPREELMKDGETLAQKALFRLIPTPKEKATERAEESSGMVLKSAYPILDFNGEVLGVIAGGVLLNRNYEIVDLIKNIVYKDERYKGKDMGTATIFMEDLRISTNVMDRQGTRAVGTRAMKEVFEQVIEKGLPWVHRAFVVDDWYITAYEPIRDIQGNIVGMLYVGMLESKYAAIKEKIILLFLLFSMSGMFLALAVSFFLSRKMFRK